MPLMLDLFCGRLGWSKAFLARGWEVTAVDLVEPPEIPQGVTFIQIDVLKLPSRFVEQFDFVCASSPCQEFSVHGMKHFHPNPKYPENGIMLFEHTRQMCERAMVPYVMENVRAAQQFVGNAANHCGPFYLWGTAVPPLVSQGLKKGQDFKAKYPPTPEMIRRGLKTEMFHVRSSMSHKERAGQLATIPPELANCVADYADRLIEQRTQQTSACVRGR